MASKGEPITIWFAAFKGIGEIERVEVVMRDAFETAKRVTVPPREGSYEAEMRLEPKNVNRTAKQAIDRLAESVKRRRDYAEWVLEEAERHERLIAAIRAARGIE